MKRGDLRPGDLVFFHRLGHVGMYIGEGRFVHAPRRGVPIKRQKLTGYYDRTYVGAMRPGWPDRLGSTTGLDKYEETPADAVAKDTKGTKDKGTKDTKGTEGSGGSGRETPPKRRKESAPEPTGSPAADGAAKDVSPEAKESRKETAAGQTRRSAPPHGDRGAGRSATPTGQGQNGAPAYSAVPPEDQLIGQLARPLQMLIGD